MHPWDRLDRCLWRETPPCIFNNFFPPNRSACLSVNPRITPFYLDIICLSFSFCPFLFALQKRAPPLFVWETLVLIFSPLSTSSNLPFLYLYLPSNLPLYLSSVPIFPAWLNYKYWDALSFRCYRKLSYEVG